MDHRKLPIGKRRELYFLALVQGDEVREESDCRGWQVHHVMGEEFRLRDHDWVGGGGGRSVSGDFAAEGGGVIRVSELVRSGADEGVAVLAGRSDELGDLSYMSIDIFTIVPPSHRKIRFLNTLFLSTAPTSPS